MVWGKYYSPGLCSPCSSFLQSWAGGSFPAILQHYSSSFSSFCNQLPYTKAWIHLFWINPCCLTHKQMWRLERNPEVLTPISVFWATSKLIHVTPSPWFLDVIHVTHWYLIFFIFLMQHLFRWDIFSNKTFSYIFISYFPWYSFWWPWQCGIQKWKKPILVWTLGPSSP